jgi:hypothetical protein
MSPTPTQSNGLSSPSKQHKVHKAAFCQLAFWPKHVDAAQKLEREMLFETTRRVVIGTLHVTNIET